MDADGSIRTQFDDLVAAIKKAGHDRISVAELSSATGLSTASVMKWLALLEKNGQVHAENRMSGVYVYWAGEPEKAQPHVSHGAVDAVSNKPYQSEIDLARQREEEAREGLARTQAASDAAPEDEEGTADEGQAVDAVRRHQEVLESAGADLVDVSERIEKIGSLISELKRRKSAQKKEGKTQEPSAQKMTLITEDTPDASSPLDRMAAEKEPAAQPIDVFGEPDIEEPIVGAEPEEADALAQKQVETAKKLKPKVLPVKRKMPAEEAVEKEQEAAEPAKTGLREPVDAEPEQIKPELLEPTLISEERRPAIQIKPMLPKRKVKIQKIARIEPVQPTSVSLQFSERMARHVRKIVAQSQEIEKLKMEKEKLLNEHYLPMQRKLEVEIETISDRVLRMEKNILAIQERASELPNRVQGVEKLQISTIKAHAEMRKAHDEAGALVEEATQLLSEEREKMSEMVEQSRQELAEHRAKSEELSRTIERINRMEEEASSMVIAARGALAEQAERLAVAEVNAQELVKLKEEISEGVATSKREMGAAKGVLTGLEKQMSQMRQIEIWAGSIKQEYEKKMVDIDDYIRNGNTEFETLRESVEANFVRRYLRELRQLTDSYTFELNQVKNAEGNIDQRITEEKKKLDDLLEEGRKIAYLYEMQSREVEGGDAFEQHGEEFRTLSEISAQRTQLEQMIAQVVGNKSEYKGKELSAWPEKRYGMLTSEAARKTKSARAKAGGKKAPAAKASSAKKAGSSAKAKNARPKSSKERKGRR